MTTYFFVAATEKFLTAIFVFFSTMALGLTLVYIIYISIKLSGLAGVLRSLKDPRKKGN